MADVFLSYARADRTAAERLANAIGKTGLTVWWDRHIKGGSEFSRDIERQLEMASRVLVLWSKEAVDSRWVRDEASVAADSRRLVSATIDGTPPPLGFRQFQTIDLSNWSKQGAEIPAELADALDVDTPSPAAPKAGRLARTPMLALGIAALLAAGAATLALVQPAPFDGLLSGEPEREPVSLAIMPFETPEKSDIDYLGPALATALSDSLAHLEALKLISSTSTQALAGKGLTAPEIAAKLGITHLVEGDIQKLGERYAISLRLIDARSSEQIWTRRVEGEADELQGLKSHLARELASALRARLGVGQGELVERGDIDPRAYEAYLKGLERVSVRVDPAARVEAIKQFRLAASIEPDFADAHAGYAYLMALSQPWQLGMPWSEIIAEQKRAADRALKLDPDNDLAMIASAVALHNFHGEAERSNRITRQVLERSPNFGPAHYAHASGLVMLGKGREALHHMDLAIELDPFDELLREYRAYVLYSLGDYEAVRSAVAECADCEQITFAWGLAIMGFATPDQFREDWPDFAKRALTAGLTKEFLDNLEKTTEALILGRPFAPDKPEREEWMDFANAAIAARLISFEEGLRYARIAADRRQPDSVIDILSGGRISFTPEQRADPRYHQLFRHPKLVHIANSRRKAGLTEGLPVFPVKPYSGR